MQQFCQKHILAIANTGTMFLNFYFFEIIIKIDIINATKKPIPIPNAKNEFFQTNLCCWFASKSGSVCPKYTQMNAAPISSISIKNRGMQMYITRAGIMNVDTTIKKQRMATQIRANAIYRNDLESAMKGPPYSDLATSVYNSDLVICMALADMTPNAMTVARSTRYSNRQMMSVHFRYSMGPFLHWTGVLLSLIPNESSYIVQIKFVSKILISQLSEQPVFVNLNYKNKFYCMNCLFVLKINGLIYVQSLQTKQHIYIKRFEQYKNSFISQQFMYNLLLQFVQTSNLIPNSMSISSLTVGSKIKYKIVLLGDQYSGKTAIIDRFINEKFQDSYNPTIGIDFLVKNVVYSNKTYRLQLWDTAGQERFKSLIPSYLKDSNCALIVFDVNSQKSLQNVSKWSQLYNQHKQKSAYSVIVANKIDLPDHSCTDQMIDQQISKLKIKQKCFKISAKTGQGIMQLFRKVVQITNDRILNTKIIDQIQQKGNEEESVSPCKIPRQSGQNLSDPKSDKKIKLQGRNKKNNQPYVQVRQNCC